MLQDGRHELRVAFRHGRGKGPGRRCRKGRGVLQELCYGYYPLVRPWIELVPSGSLDVGMLPSAVASQDLPVLPDRAGVLLYQPSCDDLPILWRLSWLDCSAASASELHAGILQSVLKRAVPGRYEMSTGQTGMRAEGAMETS